MKSIWYIGFVYNTNIFKRNTFWKKDECSSFIHLLEATMGILSPGGENGLTLGAENALTWG